LDYAVFELRAKARKRAIWYLAKTTFFAELRHSEIKSTRWYDFCNIKFMVFSTRIEQPMLDAGSVQNIRANCVADSGSHGFRAGIAQKGNGLVQT
jgi:hypothetical protein